MASICPLWLAITSSSASLRALSPRLGIPIAMAKLKRSAGMPGAYCSVGTGVALETGRFVAATDVDFNRRESEGALLEQNVLVNRVFTRQHEMRFGSWQLC
jgi:hypothetical protein